MRLAAPRSVLAALLSCCLSCSLWACDRRAPTPGEIADRGWRAHELVVAAGERAPTCAAAGVAMYLAFIEHRQAFVDAIALDRDRRRMLEAIAYLEEHADRYADLDTRTAALSDRCAGDASVAAVFFQMARP